MEPIGIPLIVVSVIWFAVGGIVPFFIRGANKEYFKLFASLI